MSIEQVDVSSEHTELDELQAIAEVDAWEQASFEEDELRNGVKAAKSKYEDALRAKFFNF